MSVENPGDSSLGVENLTIKADPPKATEITKSINHCFVIITLFIDFFSIYS